MENIYNSNYPTIVLISNEYSTLNHSDMDSSQEIKKKKTSSSDKWTTEMKRSFIQLLKNKENIWNTKCPSYKHRLLRKKSFQEIREKLTVKFPHHAAEFTPDKLQKKFSILKTIFQRNVSKIKNLTNEAGYDTEEASVSWVHFKALMFLNDTEKNQEKSISNLEDDIEENQEKTIANLEDDNEENQVKSISNFEDDIEKNQEKNIANLEDDNEENQEKSIPIKDGNEQNREKNIANLEDDIKKNQEKSISNLRDSMTKPNILKMNSDEPASLGKCVSNGSQNDAASDISSASMPSSSKDFPTFQNGEVAKSRAKRKRPLSAEDELLLEAVKFLRRTQPHEDGIEEVFGHYIAQLLKSIPDVRKRLQAQKKMLKTAFKFLE